MVNGFKKDYCDDCGSEFHERDFVYHDLTCHRWLCSLCRYNHIHINHDSKSYILREEGLIEDLGAQPQWFWPVR